MIPEEEQRKRREEEELQRVLSLSLVDHAVIIIVLLQLFIRQFL